MDVPFIIYLYRYLFVTGRGLVIRLKPSKIDMCAFIFNKKVSVSFRNNCIFYSFFHIKHSATQRFKWVTGQKGHLSNRPSFLQGPIGHGLNNETYMGHNGSIISLQVSIEDSSSFSTHTWMWKQIHTHNACVFLRLPANCTIARDLKHFDVGNFI